MSLDITEYRDIARAILDRDPIQYEELRPNYEAGYRCFWCERWTHESEKFEHDADCLYLRLKRFMDALDK